MALELEIKTLTICKENFYQIVTFDQSMLLVCKSINFNQLLIFFLLAKTIQSLNLQEMMITSVKQDSKNSMPGLKERILALEIDLKSTKVNIEIVLIEDSQSKKLLLWIL